MRKRLLQSAAITLAFVIPIVAQKRLGEESRKNRATPRALIEGTSSTQKFILDIVVCALYLSFDDKGV